MRAMDLYMGVDVGSSSARAGLFTEEGKQVALGSARITTFKGIHSTDAREEGASGAWELDKLHGEEAHAFAEQSSDEVWQAICRATHAAAQAAAMAASPGASHAAPPPIGPPVVYTRSRVHVLAGAECDIGGVAAVLERVRGISFDATCSLVALDADMRPVSVGGHGDDRRNIIMWCDHRAVDQTDRINGTRHRCLEHVGGRLSPEMQPGKLLWVKERLPASWARVAYWMDLADFLTWRASGDCARSMCTLACKWGGYMAHEGRWDGSFWHAVGLGELADDGFARIGTRARKPGAPLGDGLSARAAKELGLRAGTAVGAGLIDAHAGGVGLFCASGDATAAATEASRVYVPDAGHLYMSRSASSRSPSSRSGGSGGGGGSGSGDSSDGGRSDDADAPSGEGVASMCVIWGTSTCHMVVSPKAISVPGVWGPFAEAMLPNLWLTEGGQSATGALVDHVVGMMPRAVAALRTRAAELGDTRSLFDLLDERVAALAGCGLERGPDGAALQPNLRRTSLTHNLHVCPDFNGNRSPLADPKMRGSITGMTLGDGPDDLALLYLAAIQAVAHGLRHVLEVMTAAGLPKMRELLVTGGASRNPMLLRELADVTQCRVVVPRGVDAVLLGSAVLATVAAGKHESMWAAVSAMKVDAQVVEPTSDDDTIEFHARKQRVFRLLQEDQLRYKAVMEGREP